MIGRFSACAVVLLAGAPLAAQEDETMLGLRDGGVLWGKISEHDENGVEFVRLDNGGRVRLAWDLLDPRFERELRERLGYLDLAGDELLVTADLLRTIDGQEIVGLIVHHTDDAVHVKTASTLVAIPKLRIAGPATLVRVPALDVYTKAELYQLESAARRDELEAGGARGAAAHFALAQYCERILDYANAVVHYEQARAEDPGFRPRDLADATARAERKAAAQEQVDFLGEIRRERQRGNYERALSLAASFPSLFPKSPLFEELYELRASVERSRLGALTKAVAERWHHWAGRLASQAARELDFDAAAAWVERRMGEEVLSAVAGDLRGIDSGITPERVRELWFARDEKRIHRASYGSGTWLLGDEKARAGLEVDRGANPPKSERDAAREDLEDRIRRFLAQQGTGSRGGRARTEIEPADYWKTWTSAGRAQWLLAHYAEFGGDMELRDVQFRACGECGGTGVNAIEYSGPAVSGSSPSRTSRLACPICQHVGIVRRVVYR